MAYRKRRPGNKGKTCQRRQRVYVKGYGWAWRCKSYSKTGSTSSKRSASSKSKSKSKASKRKSGYRKGHRPFNKGKACVEFGVNRLGRLTCRSYGAVYGGKKKNRRRSVPGFAPISLRSARARNQSSIPGGGYIPAAASNYRNVPSAWMAL